MGVWIEHGFKGNRYPLTHGNVCWNWHTGTVTSTSEAAGFPDDDAMPPRTDRAWRPNASTGTWTLTFGEAKALSFVGIAKHDLGTQNAELTIEYNDGSGWESIDGFDTVPVSDNQPILALFAERSATAVRVTIESADAAPTISIIMAGETDEWPMPFVWPGLPITESEVISFENNISMTGNFLGRTRMNSGLSFSLSMNYASEEWRQNEFASFKEYANGEEAVFFVAARPSENQEVAFAWCPKIVVAEREMPHHRVSTTVTLDCVGLRIT